MTMCTTKTQIKLLSVLDMLFTRILNSRSNNWAETYSVLIEAQAGFRPGISTTNNIFVLNGLGSYILNQGNKLYCAFVDYTKAFDYIVHGNLWYKMIKYGLKGKSLNIITSMHSKVKSRVSSIIKLIINSIVDLEYVRENVSLHYLFFCLFLNDIEVTFIQNGLEGLDIDTFKLFMLLYADDIVIFANSAEQLQESLNMLSDYCRRWKLTVNVSKTKIMVFRKGGLLARN